MTASATFRAQDVVCVTSEDDAVEDLSVRMEHARRLADALRSVDPASLVVHPCDNSVSLLVRAPGLERGLKIGTTLGRRFRADPMDAETTARMLEIVQVALDRYGTIDPRQEETDRRARTVFACVLSEQTVLMPDLDIDQMLMASDCPWSPIAANLGGWEHDEWSEPFVDMPEGTSAYMPCATETSIDQHGRTTVSAHTFRWLGWDEEDAKPIDAMARLRLQSELLRSDGFPDHPRPGRG